MDRPAIIGMFLDQRHEYFVGEGAGLTELWIGPNGYLPLNGAEIVIRKPKVEEADVPAGEAA